MGAYRLAVRKKRLSQITCVEDAEACRRAMFQFGLIEVLQPFKQTADWTETPTFIVPCFICALS